jgi:cytochrome c oxidase assembly factor CtaG
VSAEWFALLGGIGLLAAAVTPVVRAVAETSLSAHMVQHVALLQIAPLLIVSGWPIAEDRRDWTRNDGGRTVIRAWMAGVAAMTLWYAPPLFEWMLRSFVPSLKAYALASLLVLVPIAGAVDHFASQRNVVTFAVSAVAILPLAADIGRATDALAER